MMKEWFLLQPERHRFVPKESTTYSTNEITLSLFVTMKGFVKGWRALKKMSCIKLDQSYNIGAVLEFCCITLFYWQHCIYIHQSFNFVSSVSVSLLD